MKRRALIVIAVVFAIVGGLSGSHAARKSCDVMEISVGKIVFSTEPICYLPCIYGQPLCGETSVQSGETTTPPAVPGAGR